MAANKRHINKAIELNSGEKPEGYKYCTKCVLLKPYTDFYKDKKCEGGVRADCKECFKAYMNSKYCTNPEPAKQRAVQQRERIKANPELLALEQANMKLRNDRYKINHPDRIKEPLKIPYRNKEKPLSVVIVILQNVTSSSFTKTFGQHFSHHFPGGWRVRFPFSVMLRIDNDTKGSL